MKDGDVLHDCGSAPAAASGWPQAQRHRGLLDPQREADYLRNSVVVHLSVQDRVAVGGGRLVLGGSLKTQPRGFLEGCHHPMHRVQGHL